MLISIYVWRADFSFLIRSNSKHNFMNKSEEGNLSSPGHSHMTVKSEFYSQGGLWGSFGSLLIYVWKVRTWACKRPCHGSWSTWNILGIKRFCLRKVSGPEDNSSIHQSWQKDYTCFLPLKLERVLIPRKTHGAQPWVRGLQSWGSPEPPPWQRRAGSPGSRGVPGQ